MLELFPWIFGFVVVVGGGATFIWWRRQYGIKSFEREQASGSQAQAPTAVIDAQSFGAREAKGTTVTNDAGATDAPPRVDPYGRRGA
jgi:hypothetical protein